MKNHVIEKVSRAGLPSRFTRLATIVFIIVAGVGLARPSLADQITLKGSVRLPEGTTVVQLADIAELTGPLGDRYADVVISELVDRTQVVEITIQQVRRKLTEAGVHWGKVQLSGQKVIIRPPGTSASRPLLAMAPASIKRTSGESRRAARSAEPESAVDLVTLPTLRGAVAQVIVQGMHIDPGDLRVIFDDRDTAFLNTSQEAFQFEIEPLSSFGSDRIELMARAWSQGRIVRSQSLSIRPLVKTNVAVLRRDIERGEQLSEEDFTVEPRWLPPRQAGAMSTVVHAVGRIAGAKLRVGDALRKQNIKREVLIKRGDRVMVRCLVGGVVISLEAEARGQAAKGESIELRKLGERDTFFAVATGPSAAIVDLSR